MWFYRKHFKLNFAEFGLKELITTCYKNDNSDLFSTHNSGQSFARTFDGERSRSAVMATLKVKNV